ncbi:hypothetical protein D3C78_1201610 [compost metagenome]
MLVRAVQAIGGQARDDLVRGSGLDCAFDLDHCTGWVVRQVRPGRQRHIVGLSIGAVDDQIGRVIQFVGQSFARHAANEGASVVAGLKHGEVALLPTHGPLHGADDVAALSHGPQCVLRIGMDSP